MIRISVIDDPLYQWDIGRRVRILTLKGETIDNVHYSNGMVAEVTVEDGYVTAPIPNILLQTAQNITVYAVVVSADGIRTACDSTFPVRAKPKPDDYVYTETEIKTWEQLESEISKAAQSASEAVESVNRLEEEVEDIKNQGVSGQAFANALKGNKSGSAVALTDISPIEHTLGVKASRGNLLPFPYAFTSQSINGIDVVVNNDGTMSISEVPTKATALRFSNNLVLEKGQYFLKVLQEKQAVSTNVYYAYVQVGDKYYYDNGLGAAFTITEQTSVIVGLIIGTSYDGTETTFKPQINLGTVATPYVPYIADVSTAKVQRYRKNLFNPTYTPTNKTIKMQNSIVAEHNQAYIVSFDKECTEIDFIAELADGTTQTKYITFGNTFARFKVVGNIVNYGNNFAATQTFDKPIVKFSISAYGSTSNGWGDTAPLAQLEINTQQTEYEPYREPTTYDISTDGTVEGVTSLYPTTTLISDTEGVVLDVEYNRDINKAFAELQNAIISIGGILSV